MYCSESGTGPSSKLWMPRITAQYRRASENNGNNFSQPDHTDTQMFFESSAASVTEVLRHSLMNQRIGISKTATVNYSYLPSEAGILPVWQIHLSKQLNSNAILRGKNQNNLLTLENKSKHPSRLMTQYTSGRRGPLPLGW